MILVTLSSESFPALAGIICRVLIDTINAASVNSIDGVTKKLPPLEQTVHRKDVILITFYRSDHTVYLLVKKA